MDEFGAQHVPLSQEGEDRHGEGAVTDQDPRVTGSFQRIRRPRPTGDPPAPTNDPATSQNSAAVSKLQNELARVSPLAHIVVSGGSLQDLENYTLLRRTLLLGAALGFLLALLSFVFAAMDRAVERRSAIATLVVVGAPVRLLRAAQRLQLLVPLALGLSLAALSSEASAPLDTCVREDPSTAGTPATPLLRSACPQPEPQPDWPRPPSFSDADHEPSSSAASRRRGLADRAQQPTEEPCLGPNQASHCCQLQLTRTSKSRAGTTPTRLAFSTSARVVCLAAVRSAGAVTTSP